LERFGARLSCLNRAPTNGKAARRFQAWQQQPQGWAQRQLAEALGVSEAAVSPWMRRAREGGPEALRHQPPPGAPRRLPADLLARLPALWHRGAAASGFRGQVWTWGRIAAGMRLEFGAADPPVPVGRWLKPLRWRPQKPARRARPRRSGRARWREETWPALNRGPTPRGQTLLFIDASGFSPWPSVVRTDAPRGPTLILREWHARDPLSAISAISPEGRRHFHSQDRGIDADDVVVFLEPLLREGPSQRVMIWDGAPIHRSHLITEFPANGAAPRLQVERLPAYAPALNPGEGLWAHLKGVERRNVGCFTIRHRRHDRRDAVKRVQRKPRISQAGFRGAKLSIFMSRSVSTPTNLVVNGDLQRGDATSPPYPG
jgi:transposase